MLNQLDDGRFACPICGAPWPYPPYSPNDGELGPLHPVSTPSFGDVCDCGVEFGVDEGVAPNAPKGAQRLQWARLRLNWLDRVGWNPAAMKQLHENLGLAEDRLRREAEELRE